MQKAAKRHQIDAERSNLTQNLDAESTQNVAICRRAQHRTWQDDPTTMDSKRSNFVEIDAERSNLTQIRCRALIRTSGRSSSSFSLLAGGERAVFGRFNPAPYYSCSCAKSRGGPLAQGPGRPYTTPAYYYQFSSSYSKPSQFPPISAYPNFFNFLL